MKSISSLMGGIRAGSGSVQSHSVSAPRFSMIRIANDGATNAPSEVVNDITDAVLLKLTVYDSTKERSVQLSITERAIYESTGRMHELLDVHTIEPDPSDPQALFVHWFKSSAAMVGKKVKVGMMRGTIDARELIHVRRFCCQSVADQEKLALALEYQVRWVWQRLCEQELVLAPDAYQTHEFVVKINRKEHGQDRVLILSSLWIYNVVCTHCSTSIKEAKWAIPIQSLTELTIDSHFNSPLLSITFDHGIVSKMVNGHQRQGHSNRPPKTKHQFCFYSQTHMDAFVTELQRLTFNITGGSIKVVSNLTPIPDQISNFGAFPMIQQSYLMKSRKQGKEKGHRRFVRLSSVGTISWAESPNSARPLEGRVVSFALADQSLSFIVQTSTKTLQFAADSESDLQSWLAALKTVASSNSIDP